MIPENTGNRLLALAGHSSASSCTWEPAGCCTACGGRHPSDRRWRGATFETIRRTFVKVAVRVQELKGKIKLAFPASYPQAATLAAMTGAITTHGP